MKLSELARAADARVLSAGADDPEIEHVHSGDRVSDLLEKAGHHTLLVTTLGGGQLVRVAQLMDMPAICLVNGASPASAMLSAAAAEGKTVLVSPLDMETAHARLAAALESGRPATA